MTHLTNFYKDNKDKLIEPHVDYTVKKLKEDLVNRRKELAKMPKNPNFSREEICDIKYFKHQLAEKKRSEKANGH